MFKVNLYQSESCEIYWGLHTPSLSPQSGCVGVPVQAVTIGQAWQLYPSRKCLWFRLVNIVSQWWYYLHRSIGRSVTIAHIYSSACIVTVTAGWRNRRGTEEERVKNSYVLASQSPPILTIATVPTIYPVPLWNHLSTLLQLTCNINNTPMY